MPVAAGSRLGPYEIHELLGAGSMGEVYVARDLRLERKIALKLLPSHLTTDQTRVRRFEQEARAASALNHPNIVTIYDVGEADTHRFIAMEFVTGRTLRALASGPLPIDAVLAWGSQIARALSVSHAAGIVHRDIKPDNVMVRDDGYVKVLDFGLAQLAANSGVASVSATEPGTAPGTLLGTVRYMSPEQARGEFITGAADVFALGTLLYELVTGRHPLPARTLLELLHAIEHHMPAPASRVAGEVPAELDDLLIRMLHKTAALRPTAPEVERTLSGLAHGPHAPARVVPSPPAASTEPARPTQPRVRRSLVGRQRERTMLRETFEAAASGRGSLLCVTGEPGIGKTTLVEEFLAELTRSEQPCRVAQGRCSERLAGTEAFLPWLEAFETLLRDDAARGAPGRETFDSATQMMRRLAPSWYAQVAASGEDASSAARVLAELKSTSQERMKRELAQFLEQLSARQPLVLFFDDLHWADVSTVDLLAFLGTRLASMRVLILATYRPSDLHLAKHPFLQIKPDLQARGVSREFHLGFLSPGDVAAYLALEFPDHEFPAALPAMIHAKTEGSPLFMADLVRYLRDRGVIAQREGRWAVAMALPEIDRDLPESVRAMIERKIAQLSEDDRRLLVAASVQGYRFDSAVLARALGLDAGDVEERLDTLERVYGFVRAVGEYVLPDRSLTLRCQFVHLLYQGALYASLTPTRRAALSRRVAETLIAAHGEQRSSVAAELADLYVASRDHAQAAHYFGVAAEAASRVFANHEAAALARRGIAALQAAPDAKEHRQQELAFRLILGSAFMNSRGPSATEVEEAYGSALKLAQEIGDASGLHQGLWGLALCHLTRAEYGRTKELALALLRLGEERQDRGILTTAHYVLGTVFVYLGEFAPAQEHYFAGLQLSESPDGVHLRLPDGRDPALSCRAQLGRVLWLLGRPEEAKKESHQALVRAEQQAQPLTMAFTLFLEMMLQQFLRDAAATRQRAERLMALSREHDLRQYATWAGVLHGWASAVDDDPAGIAELRDSLAAQARMGSELSRPHFLALLADALRHARRVEEGLAAVAEGLACSAVTRERYYEAELHRLRGELLVLKGNVAEATACFHEAFSVAEQQGAVCLAMRAAISLARAERLDGRDGLGRARLRELCPRVADGTNLREMIEARELLRD